jgi:protein-S-isoprenylcysteine O-methyltransferase Ste14
MTPAAPKALILIAAGMLGLIRGLHTLRKPRAAVATRREGWRELFVLLAVLVGFIVPVVWASSTWLAFADFAPRALPIAAGVAALVVGLWLFHRTHADLGANWSARLQIVDAHRLVTSGIYRFIRHPMYLSLILYGLGEALVAPNWVAGPCGLTGAVLLAALRIGPEEAMMRERFGQEYDEYAARTGRILPRFQTRR